MRNTRRSLLQRGIECFSKGFNIWIGNKAYNWQAAARFAQKFISASQQQSQVDTSADSPASLKRKTHERSPQDWQRTQLNKKSNKPNMSIIRSSSLSQHTQGGDAMETTFTELFDNI